MDKLRDIHIPEAGWLQIPLGYWLILAGILLSFVLLTVLSIWLHHRYFDNPRPKRPSFNARQAATTELEQIMADYAEHDNADQAIEKLTILLRQLAVLRYGREACAGLAGQAWVRFLNEQTNASSASTVLTLSGAAATAVAESQYRQSTATEVTALHDYLARYIRHKTDAKLHKPSNPNKPSNLKKPKTGLTN